MTDPGVDTESPTEELEVVRRVSQSLFESIDHRAIIISALHTALKELDAEAGSILLPDEEAQRLVFHHSVGEILVPAGTSIPWDEGISGAVFQSGEPALTTDVSKSKLHFQGIDRAFGHTTRDMISIPLKQWGGRPIGVLNIVNKKNGRFDENDLTILMVISAFASLAIRQAQLFEDARLAEVARTLGNVGHDLKNLITPIISSSAFLKEELDELFDMLPESGSKEIEDKKQICFESIDTILKTGDRIKGRVKEMADAVKGRTSPPSFEVCYLEHVVGDVMDSLRPSAEEAGLVLESQNLAQLPPVLGDPVRLYTAFYNLVINAIAQGRPGGRVTIRAERFDADRVVVAVCDDGRGMSAEVRDSLFSNKSISRSRGGTGLGTRIVKDVMDAHGGKISVKSEPDAGATFTVELRRAPHAEPGAPGIGP